jgi:hypothetical protein
MFISESRVSLSSDYTFELQTSQIVPAGGQIRINLDADFGLATFGSSVDCTATYGFTSAASCSVGSNLIIIEDAFPTTEFLVIFTVRGIINPSYEAEKFPRVFTYTPDL